MNITSDNSMNTVADNIMSYICFTSKSNKMSQSPTDYKHSRSQLLFDGNYSKYKLWEVKFVSYIWLWKFNDIILSMQDCWEIENYGERNAGVFIELIQCLDNKSLSLFIHNAKDNDRKVEETSMKQYVSKGKPNMNNLYTELTPLRK